MIQCTRPATVKQQMTHRARIDLLLSGTSLRDVPAERYLCDEHADLIDKDWIAVPLWFDVTVLCVHGLSHKQCDTCLKGFPQCQYVEEEVANVGQTG